MFLPSDFGFDTRSELRDRTQLHVLNLASRIEPRLVLKGGLAMRCAHSTARLTEDVDFDADSSVSDTSIASTIRRSVQGAISGSKMTRSKLRNVKLSAKGTSRWVVEASSVDSVPMKWKIEVSRRPALPGLKSVKVRVDPPAQYRLPPFTASIYDASSLIHLKVLALLSPNRNATRDLYDLYVLLNSVNKSWLIADAVRQMVVQHREGIDSKILGLGFAQARTELLPYLPRQERDALDESRWNQMASDVSRRLTESTGPTILPTIGNL